MAVGVSLLEDTLGTIQYDATSGDGVPTASLTLGSAVSINIDKFTLNETINTADHSGGQDIDEWHRLTKRASSGDLEYKFGPQSGVNVKNLRVGVRVKIIAVATLGTFTATCTIQGLIVDMTIEFAGPSTGKITVKPCGGTPLVIIA